MASKSKHSWAIALSEAFKDWCASRGINPFQALKEWGIDADARYEILTRQSLTGKMEAYAIIFDRTWLREADPRQRPFTQKARPWSENQWLEWKQTGKTQTTGDNLGARMNELLTVLKTQGNTKEARDRIAREYAAEIDALAVFLDAFTQSADNREQALFLRGVVSDE